MSKPVKYSVLGVMSGTSLDGLDLALCEFIQINDQYNYSVIKAQTIPYSDKQRTKLTNISYASAENYFRMNHLFGKYIAGEITNFLKDVPQQPILISSHGHTIFHQPSFGFSTQIGCGATIAALTGIETVCDLRNVDVALGGQGAPLVPVGDKLLFSQYESCLNLGGISNISFDSKGKRRAFDICFVNIALNYFANNLGFDYDKNGQAASRGKLSEELLTKLNQLPFYKSTIAKSLGRESFEKEMLPIIDDCGLSIQDILNTLVHHIAFQIAKVLKENKIKDVLITGGGAYNTFLIETLRAKYDGNCVIPDDLTVNFKEAVIFAFLGLLRSKNKINTLNSVTGSKKDSSGGAIYSPNKKNV